LAAAWSCQYESRIFMTRDFRALAGAVEAFGVFANVLFSHNSLVGIMTFGLGSRPACLRHC